MGKFWSKKTHDLFTDPAKLIPDNKSDPIGLHDEPPVDTAGELARAEEARKEALRARIDQFYGVGGSPEAVAARGALEGENTRLAEATRSYYTDALARDYGKGEKKLRFALARGGTLGGSSDVDRNAELQQDRNLGAVRLDEAVSRAVANLRTAREQERGSAIGLVNSGAGESSIASANAGLRNAFDNVSNAQKVDLFGDLFQVGADAQTKQNFADQQQAMLDRYRNRLSSFYPTNSGAAAGRVTET